MSSELFFLRPAIFNVYLALPLLGLLSQFKPDLSLVHYCIVLLYYKTSKVVRGSDVILASITSALVSRIPPCIPKAMAITEGGEIRTVSHCIPLYGMQC